MTDGLFDEGNQLRSYRELMRAPEPLLTAFGKVMVGESRRAFRDQQFGEVAWNPRSVPNVAGIISDFSSGNPREVPKRRFEERPALIDGGDLRRRLEAGPIGSHEFSVGSAQPYAGVHQAGGRTETPPLTEETQSKIARWLKTKQGQPWQPRLGFLVSPTRTNTREELEVPRRPFVGFTRRTIPAIQAAARRIFRLGLS